MTTLYRPSGELTKWAARAGYAVALSEDSNATVFWSDPGGEIRYYCRLQDDRTIRLTRVLRDGPEQFVLLAAADAILERYLIGRFGDVIRDGLGLEVLRAPWSSDQVAAGYMLTDLDDGGYRTLVADGTTVATAREDTLSVLALVPLSHYMRLSIADLIASFLDVNGAPLLVNGIYGWATGGWLTLRDNKRLVSEWNYWSRVPGMTGTSVQQDDHAGIRFRSGDGDYHLRTDEGWWVIDESDERGKWYPAIAAFSTIELAEKYLIWTWASTARTSVGAEQLGRNFQQRGFNEEVRHSPAVRANFVELTAPGGFAVVPSSQSAILSHVLLLSLARLGEMLREGL